MCDLIEFAEAIRAKDRALVIRIAQWVVRKARAWLR